MSSAGIKIQVVSDLHGEREETRKALTRIDFSAPCDIAILAGDVSSHTDAAELAASLFRHAGTIVMVAGNHEYYGLTGSIDELLAIGKENAAAMRKRGVNIHLLENEILSVPVRGVDVHIAGATLWTDYKLYGSNTEAAARKSGVVGMNDFLRIDELSRLRKDPLLATDILARKHAASRAFLSDFVRSPATPKIVVTHHLPSVRSISPQYGGHPLNSSFASNLDDIIAEGEWCETLWIHGHTHSSQFWRSERGSPVVSNPAGYALGVGADWIQFENGAFYEDFVVSLTPENGAWRAVKDERGSAFGGS